MKLYCIIHRLISVLFINTMLCLLTLLFMFLDMDAIKHQRLNKQDFKIKKQCFSECNDQLIVDTKEITKSFTLKKCLHSGLH